MFVADWVAEVFRNNSVERVFLYPGGTIAPLINACIKQDIQIECFKSEQGAGYAALAYARITGRPQVVMVTSGPGVTNVISPLADAFYDSTPLILVSGQIGTGDLKVRKAVRQRGFQETPAVELTKPVSKKASCMMSLDNVFQDIPEAFHLSMSERKGPVVIDFPMDMQRLEISDEEIRFAKTSNNIAIKENESLLDLNLQILDEVAAAASQAKRPVILLGHGALSAAAFSQYTDLAKAIDAYVVTSFLGIGSYDSLDTRYLGYLGHTGHIAANKAVYECDFLLVLGSRLDVRQTGTEINKFVSNGNVAWINLDLNELENPRVDVKWKIKSDVKKFCTNFLDACKGNTNGVDDVWSNNLLALKNKQLEDIPKENSIYVQPRPVLQYISKLMEDSAVTVVTGIGCHQHWAARHLAFCPSGNSFLSSGGHGTMGYDLPSAIGAAMAQPDRRVLCVVGDGSLLMNIQELASLNERELDVKILVMNNSRLGIVSQFQLITWGTDPTTGDFKSPDFAMIARGFGLEAERLQSTDEFEIKINNFWNMPGPALLEVNIDPEADVVPMLLGGQHMGEMWMGRKL
jgi:acetolactate synthase-1/2/3 large subunit